MGDLQIVRAAFRNPDGVTNVAKGMWPRGRESFSERRSSLRRVCRFNFAAPKKTPDPLVHAESHEESNTMSDKPDQRLSASQDPVLVNQVDSLCDAFEREMLAGAGPRIEEFLRRVPESAQAWLRDELRAVEAELRDRPTLPPRPLERIAPAPDDSRADQSVSTHLGPAARTGSSNCRRKAVTNLPASMLGSETIPHRNCSRRWRKSINGC